MVEATGDVAPGMAAIKILTALICVWWFWPPNANSESLEKQTCPPNYILGPCFQGQGQHFSGITSGQLVLSNSNLSQATMTACHFESIRASDAQFKLFELHFLNCGFSRWSHVDLRGAIINEMHLKNYSFSDVDFSGVKIRNSSFSSGDIRNARFNGAYITDTVFKDSILPKAIKSDSILINVKFENCQFI